MLHIILGILKIIGILLGIIFLLLLVALLAVIFVPIRYRLTVEIQSGQYAFSLRGSWLLHIVSAVAAVDSSAGRRIAVRLFGIRLPLLQPDAGRKREKKEKEEEPDESDTAKPKDARAAGQGDPAGTGEEREDAPQENAEQGCGPSDILQKLWFQCSRICDKIKQIPEGIRCLWQKLVRLGERAADLVRSVIRLLHKPGELMEFLEEYEAREVFGSLAGHLVFLLAHYKPRRIRGYLRFGTDNPATTGQLTGLIYILLPARADRFSVEPEFNEKVFETETACSGHIRAIHVLRVLWRGFRDKKLRRMIAACRRSGR